MNKLIKIYRKYFPLRLCALRVGDIFSLVSNPEVAYVLTRKDFNGDTDYYVGVGPISKYVHVFSRSEKVIKRNALCIVQ